ncbi:MAG: hypothetical protein JWO56_3712 [Acidobacteria bacterium]|nr:hypothetical protein [Acidobacteriota bacterium]
MIRRALLLSVLPFLWSAALQAQTLPPGLVLGPARPVAGLRVGGDGFANYLLGVAPDGDGFRAWYYRGKGSADVQTVHIGADGQTDFTSDRAAFASTSNREGFVVRTAGDRSLLFWLDSQANVRVSPAAADGTAVDSTGALLASRAFLFRAECNGSRCLVQSWGGPLDGPSDGTIINPAGEVVSRVSPPVGLAVRAADPQGFLFLDETADFHAVRLDDSGRQTFDAIVQFGKHDTWSTADFDGQQYSLIWSNADSTTLDTATYAAHLGLDGSVSSPRKIADLDHLDGQNFYRSGGDVAWNGQEHVYIRLLEGYPPAIPEFAPSVRLSVLLLDRNLIPIGSPQPLSTQADVITSRTTGLAVNRGTTYVGWNEGFGYFAQDNSMHGATIDAAGTIGSRSAIAVGPLTQNPEAVATTAEVTVAIYSELDANLLTQIYPPSHQLRFVRVTRGGTILDAEPRLLTESAQFGRVVASALGSDVLVVWNSTPYEPGSRLQAAIVHTVDGSVDRFDLSLPDTSYGLAVATNGSGWLVANGPNLAAVSRTGLVLNPTPVRYTSSFPGSVSLASDGNRYLVAWEDDTPARQRGTGPARMALVNGDGSLVFTDRVLDPVAYSVSVLFTGRDYLFVSTDLKATRLTRVSRDGTPGPSVPVTSSTRLPQLLSFAMGALLAFPNGNELSAIRLSADGAPIDSKPFMLPFSIATTTATGTLLGLRTLPADLTKNVAALQELTWSQTSIRRALSHP